MPKSLRRRLSFSNAISLLALMIALGGVSYAGVTLPRHSVGSPQLRVHAVKGPKIASGAVGRRALSSSVRRNLGPAAVRLRFSKKGTSTAKSSPVGTFNGLTLRAACKKDSGQTGMVFSLRSRRAGLVQESFQNDSGTNPNTPGTASAGNLQFKVPAGAQSTIGGPPPVPPGNYFRTIATLVFSTSKGTATVTVATLVNGTTNRCTVDGAGITATG